MVFTVVLTLVSLMANDTEYLFLYAHWPFVYFNWSKMNSDHLPVFSWVIFNFFFYFSLSSFLSSLIFPSFLFGSGEN